MTASFMCNVCPSSLVSTAATNCVFAGAARPRLPPATLATGIGIIELDSPAGEGKLAVSLHPHLHQLVSHAPRGIVGDTQMEVQRHRHETPFLPWVTR